MSTPTRSPDLKPRGTLLRELEARAAACPDETAMAYHGRQLSYQALLDASLSLAGYLQQHLGVRRGDRVLLLMHDCPQFTMAWHAVLRCRAEAVALAPDSSAQAVAAGAAASAACAAVTMQDGLPRVAPLLGDDGVRGCIVGAYSEFAGAPGSPEWLAAPDYVREPRVPLLQPRVHDFGGALAAGIAPAPVGATSCAACPDVSPLSSTHPYRSTNHEPA
ncbi:AMP-binding protein [Cupriavidus taiwanensis]